MHYFITSLGHTSKNNLLNSPRWVAEDLFSLVVLCWITLQSYYAISCRGSRCLMVLFQTTLRPPQLSWLRRCISSCCFTLPILGKDCPCVHPLCPTPHQGMITESHRMFWVGRGPQGSLRWGWPDDSSHLNAGAWLGSVCFQWHL